MKSISSNDKRLADNSKRCAGVCVVIAAMNAEGTIGEAVLSALSQPEVQEIVVVDDASTDNTAQAAAIAAAGDSRLCVLRQDANIGPAAARNLAIAQSTAPFIAVLDADDIVLADRFRHLLAEEDWDLIADNVVFVPEAAWKSLTLPDPLSTASGRGIVDLSDFVNGNLLPDGKQSKELGFVKPIVRRDFLERHDLAYDPSLRLGEDYDLYVRALAKGGRFRISARVGYAARVRAGSLSNRHTTSDLRALLEATGRHFELAGTDFNSKRALREMRRHVRARFVLRKFLDEKSQGGAIAALSFALAPPSNLLPIIKGVWSDKVAALRARQGADPALHYLLPVTLEEDPRA